MITVVNVKLQSEVDVSVDTSAVEVDVVVVDEPEEEAVI